MPGRPVEPGVKKSARKAPSAATLKKDIAVLKSDISTLKHSPTRKHAATAATLKKDQSALKKDETALAKDDRSTKHSAKRTLSPGADVACCTAEALAATLRLAGATVAAGDVLDLYFNTARDPDEGASILDTLRAAREFGLAGFRPALNEQVIEDFGDDLAVLQLGKRVGNHLFRRDAAQFEPFVNLVADRPITHALILGVQLPGGPHALALDPSGLAWSWGEPHDQAAFADAVVEECWAVAW